MLFDKEMSVITNEKQSDGMGGWLPSQPVVKGVIQVETSPVTAELALREYGLIKTTALKVFFEDLPDWFDSNDTVTVKGKTYRIIQFMDYEKLYMLLLEEVTA